MPFSNYSHIVKQHITNALGSKTFRKIVVIESDDWGAIRMPSRKVYDILEKKGLDIDDPYNCNDSLATEQDLEALFAVLAGFVDGAGNHPALTANCLVANPDFARIREAECREYFFEPFTQTLKKTPGCEGSFALWQQGMKLGLFRPQFHGREHLNVPAWLIALQKGDRDPRQVLKTVSGAIPYGTRVPGEGITWLPMILIPQMTCNMFAMLLQRAWSCLKRYFDISPGRLLRLTMSGLPGLKRFCMNVGQS